VRPGLTGIAQIFAARDIPRRNKFRYDRLYAAQQSLRLDLRLILLSFWITFSGAWERTPDERLKRTHKDDGWKKSKNRQGDPCATS
jgi:lipopolysaccharide/colanic/teichoic acid biosynthesis glycosyltransferase